MESKLTNENTIISINFEAKEILGRDKTDNYNQPTCYNETSRSLKKAWATLVANWDSKTTMYDAMHILSKSGIRMHSYCAVD